ncbi:MAG: hypothetical protein DRO08_00110 [Thermoprotei archaeon]|nr:MAG: hypothetical protein DRO08_00110 [Thermoprotei archaeon]
MEFMFNSYFKLLKLYSRLESAIETHSKKLKSLKRLIKEYLREKSDVALRKTISNIEQLEYERKIIENILMEYSKIPISANYLKNDIEIKNTLKTLDDIHALLDYFSTVALRTEYMLLRLLEKISHEDYLINQYTGLIKHNKEHIRNLKRKSSVFLNELESKVKELIGTVEDKEFVEDFLRDLSFSLKCS